MVGKYISTEISLLILLLIVSTSCTGEGEVGKESSLRKVENQQRKFELDSLLFPDRYVNDSVLLHLFHRGKYRPILTYKDSLLSKKSRDILLIATIETNFKELIDQKEEYFPEISDLNAIHGKESRSQILEDIKFLESLSLYRKYAVYRYLSREFAISLDYIDYFKRWFYYDNKNNDPIIKNEYLYILSKLSELKEPTYYISDYLHYTDSLIEVYPENYYLKSLLADVYYDIGEYNKAINMNKAYISESGDLNFLNGILYYYSQLDYDKDSLDKYEQVLENYPN